MLRIRLSRVGKKKQPAYRMVVADSRAPRDGAFLKIIGHYNPLTNPATLVVKEDEAIHWLRKGAQPSDTAAKLLTRLGIMEKAGKEPFVYRPKGAPGKPKKKAAEEPAAAAEPAAAPPAEAEAKAAPPKPKRKAAEEPAVAAEPAAAPPAEAEAKAAPSKPKKKAAEEPAAAAEPAAAPPAEAEAKAAPPKSKKKAAKEPAAPAEPPETQAEPEATE